MSYSRYLRRAMSRFRDSRREIVDGGIDIVLYGDSLTSGMNSATQFSTWAHRFKVLVQRRQWQICGFPSSRQMYSRRGGFGYLPLRDAPAASWAALAPTVYNGTRQFWWTMEGTTDWTAAAGNAINRRRASNAVAGSNVRARYFLDASNPYNRLGATSIEFLFGCETTSGAATVQYSDGDTDAGFASVSGDTVQTNSTTLGISATSGRHMGFQWTGLEPRSRTVQIAATTGTILPEGVILYNGDESSGIRVHNVGTVGASTDMVYNSQTEGATFSNWCARSGLGADNARLFTVALGANDCNQQYSLASFESRLTTIRDKILSLGAGCLFVGQPLYDPSLESQPIPYSAYMGVMADLASGQTDVDFLDLNLFPDYWDWNDLATRHHSDYGNRRIGDVLARAFMGAAF